jgi:predicted Zn-dependent protease with MMP-like domain
MAYAADIPLAGRTAATRTSFQVRVGSYTGDGIDNRAITGIGFQPDMVIVKGGANISRWRSRTMLNDATAPFATTGTDGADMIQNMTNDGFVVGTNASVNAAATIYYYVAIRSHTGQFMRLGAYRGNGSDSRNITDVGFQPDFVCIKGNNGSANGVFHTSLMADDVTGFYSATASSSDVIQSFLSNGFQIGTTVHVNSSGAWYNYWALKNIPGIVKVGQYTGDGSDDRNITGLGFQPDVIIIKAIGTTGSSRMRLSNQVGDDTLRLPAFASSANEIQSILTDGFQVGTAMNANGTVYDYLAIRAGDHTVSFTRTSI